MVVDVVEVVVVVEVEVEVEVDVVVVVVVEVEVVSVTCAQPMSINNPINNPANLITGKL
jgi:hypothetical protein